MVPQPLHELWYCHTSNYSISIASMPNIITHMIVAERAGLSETDALVGAALPDINDMCRSYGNITLAAARSYSSSTDLTAGIALHQRTDSVYMGMYEKTALLVLARNKFEELGNPIGRTPMRACADAGTKMLLDGVMWENPEVRHMYEKVQDSVITGGIPLDTTPQGRMLSAYAVNYFQISDPERYQDPESVAVMLHRRFAARKGRRMAFDKASIPEVAKVLAGQYEHLALVGQSIVTKLVEAVRL
jgi:hypothetical protein